MIGDPAGPCRSGGHERKLASDDLVVPQVGIGTAGTNAKFFGQDLDLPEFRKIPDADQLARGKPSGRVENHQIGTAGDGHPRAWLAFHERQHRLQISRRREFVVAGIGSHLVASGFTACRMAAKICE